MKFNWRANWEILLVLVIIVLGIAITTIAAIRNKDKQLLPLSEETDFGQLLADVGLPVLETPTNNSVPLDESDDRDLGNQHRPLLHSQQQQQHGAKQSGVRVHNSGYHHPAVRELQSSVNRLNNVNSGALDSARLQSKYDENMATTIGDQQQFNLLANQDRQPVDSHTIEHFHQSQQPHHPHLQHSQRQQQQVDLQDQYEALSTEPTPNQLRPEFANQALPSMNQNTQLLSLHRHHPNLEQSRRQQVVGGNRSTVAGEQLQVADPQQAAEIFPDQVVSDQVDLIDDIHTTRSSMANLESPGQQQVQGMSQQFTGTQEQQMLVNPHTLSSTLHFGSLNHQLSQLLAHQQANNNHKQLEQPQHSNLLDSTSAEDLLSSYTRYPVMNSNSSLLTEALLRDYALASSAPSPGNSSAIQQQQQLINSAVFANLIGNVASQAANQQQQVTSQIHPHPHSHAHQQQPHTPVQASPAGAQIDGAGELLLSQPQQHGQQVIHHQRRFASSLPISMLISDLLKLARPSHHHHHHQQNFSTSQADHKPHASILQQLRSLPGPLLNLLQGLSATGGGLQTSAGQHHDASESNQHYHRISIPMESLAHAALTRATPHSSVLPAFPPPQGVPQTWVPPTSGGNPNYHSAYNSNADFVASNVAGFVRSQQELSAARADSEVTSSGSFSPQSSHPQQQQLPQQVMAAGSNQQQTASQSADSNLQTPANSDEFYQSQQVNEVASSQQQQQQSYQMQASQMAPFKVLGQQQQQQQQQPQQQLIKTNPSELMGQFNTLIKQQQVNTPQKAATFISSNRQQNKNFINMPGNFQQPQQFNLPANTLVNQQQIPFNSIYGRQTLEHSQQVPLGFNGNGPSPMTQQMMYPQNQQHQSVPFTTAALEQYNSVNVGVESAPGPSVISAVSSSANLGSTSQQVRNTGTPIKRRKRSASSSSSSKKTSATGNQGHRNSPNGLADQLMSGRYMRNQSPADEEDEDDGDSRPISVVRPDGQPMNSGRIRGYLNGQVSDSERGGQQSNSPGVDSQPAQSQRLANHLNLKPLIDSNYDQDMDQPEPEHGELERGFLPVMRNNLFRQNNGINTHTEHHRQQPAAYPLKYSKSGAEKYGQPGRMESQAASGLMSKLLGTASTRDESEADEDPDEDDEANERRKEELEDAEFGIVNERPARSQADTPSLKLSGGSSSPSSSSSSSSDSNSPGGSADSGNEAASYTPRRDQRPDIEFYGHPGEETRTLKYGILGSGNYEVVNGGVYTPEAEHESIAAVNSVAKYVRKPGSLLTAKLLADQQQQQQSSFGMPGSRLGSGFMRGASAHLDTEGLTMGHQFPGSLGDHKQFSSPLLELIDANGAQLFEANMLAHLGSSVRTLHSSEPSEQQQHQQQVSSSLAHHQQQSSPSKKSKGMNKVRGKSASSSSSDKEDEDNESNVIGNDNLELDNLENEEKQLNRVGQKGSFGRVKEGRTNQFNSYQILPSKKVTIFSDQDLDSAPSETTYTSLINGKLQQPESGTENQEKSDEDYLKDYS